ncbi:MAG: filamentous hemagglutinin N-terminal domain-containing protein, partial [Symploca sp. SIO1B1]|nr:filamentous hemagglutinin N-terminal domain-containing protein [Symploca sp. SIO1B1]
EPNLFLINPNGIIFGEDSKLDVGGSFVATTANRIGLGDTGRFSASEPDSSNLLNINPDVFFFNRLSNQAEIINRSTATTPALGFFINELPITDESGLQVVEGKSLLLVGGNVSLNGGSLLAPGGRVELGGLSEPGTVELNTNSNNLSLSFPDDVTKADVLLDGAFIGTQAGGGGSIVINAQMIDMLGGSFLFAGIEQGNGSVDSQAGDIEINAQGKVNISESSFILNVVSGMGNGGDIEINAKDTVTVSESSFIANTVLANGQGTAGDIKITTDSLEVTNDATLFTTLLGEGNAGTVKIRASNTVRFEGVGSAVLSRVDSEAIGNGGEIEIITGSLEVTNGAVLNSVTAGEGNAGDVKIIARDTVRFDGVGNNGVGGVLSSVSSAGVGNGGEIEITTGSLEVTNGASLNTSTLGQGNAGGVKIRATDTVRIDGVGSNGNSSSIISAVSSAAVGDSGEIEITTNSLEVTNGAVINTNIFGRGNTGGVKIRATDTVRIDGVGNNGVLSGVLNSLGNGGVGNGGDIEIITGSLEVTNGAVLFANIFGEGNAGSVRITASDTVHLDGFSSNGTPSSILSLVGTEAVGDGGEIEITTGSLKVTNSALLNANTFGRGNAGGVKITATDTVRFDGVGANGLPSSAFSSVQSGAVGNGGDLEITTGSLEVTNGAQLSASTFAEGNAGGVRITATDTVRFDGVGGNGLTSGAFSSAEPEAVGNGGNLEITTGSLEVANGAQLSTSTLGQGHAGGVKITARDRIRFDGVGNNRQPSGAFSRVLSEAVGNGGDLEITTTNGSLEVTNGAQLSASTLGEGNAGGVRITATDTVRFDGVGRDGVSSGVFSQVNEGAIGDGGEIEITTGSLEVTNGAQLSSNTFGEGNAGDLRITATDKVRFDGVGSNSFSSVASSQVGTEAVGDGGDIEITTGSLEVTNGAFLSNSTLGEGDAGNVRITATDKVRFDGVGSNGFSSGTLSQVNQGAVGDGGMIQITTGSLLLTDAFISSVSEGNGKAGNISIDTRQNLETNRSSIQTTTLSGDGGNINLWVGNLLLLRDNSQLATTAGIAGAGGDGGDIIINAEFVVAVPREDSDISANAFNGRGGNITITTQGIFGLQFRVSLTPLSDITASSEFGLDGEFQLNLLSPVDVTQGLSELPADTVTSELNQSCQAGGSQSAGSFINTGRGGLPPDPTEPLGSSDLWEDVQLPKKTSTDATDLPTTNSGKLIEAQGWIVNQTGQIELVAQLPTTASQWGCSLR